MKLTKTLLKDEQYKNARGYRSRLALLDFAVKKFNLWEWTASHYDFSNTKTVLEVGCGTGDFWNHVQAASIEFEKVTLTDFSEGMLAVSKETLAQSPFSSKINFEIADVEALNYPDNSFDVVLAHLMLYHPTSQQKALREISRVVQKGGWVGITTFNMRIQREIFVLANQIDSRFPAYAVTIEPFDEKVADELLPKYFNQIQKYTDEVIVKVSKAELFSDFIRTHPVTQNLGLKEDFFRKFQEKIEEIVVEKGFFETAYMPVLYICKEPVNDYLPRNKAINS